MAFTNKNKPQSQRVFAVCSKNQLRRKNVENMVSLKFPRLTSRCRWKGKIVLIYAISLGLVQVVGETDGKSSNRSSSSNLNKTEENNRDLIYEVASIIALAECAVGIISNSLLLLLIYSNPLNNLRKSSWITITNLAAADLLTSILSIPWCHPVYGLTLQTANETLYRSTEILLHIGYVGSFLLLMFFAIERYIAIKYPIESGNILTKKRVFLACLLCWAAAISCAMFIILESVGFSIALYGILELSALVMILFQVLLIRSITEVSRHLEDGSDRKAHMKNISTTIVILILVLMVTAFPYFIAKQAEYLYRAYPHLFTGKMAILFPYYYFPVACLNFIINPFIYAWRLPDYRNSFKELLNRKLLHRETRSQRNSRRQFSSTIRSQKETTDISLDTIS